MRATLPLLAILAFGSAWGRARADAAPGVGSTASLDGLYFTLGPVAAAVRLDRDWTSAAGLEASLVRVRERQLPAAYGLSLGAFRYTDRDGGRVWLEAESALKRPLPVAVGLGLGAMVDLDEIRPPRWGVQSTLWIFVGIVPYVRVGVAQENGGFVEAGFMIKVPAGRLVQ